MSVRQLFSQVSIDPGDLEVPKVDLGNDATAESTVADLLEIAFSVLGAVALLIIVIAGIQFVLSRGESDKAAKARNAIIYAAVGLVIAMSAFAIVRFVVNTA